tara:strand:+ start:258 stop:524 length:267 start_codon:yes stop_codon:yes gene_type:complete
MRFEDEYTISGNRRTEPLIMIQLTKATLKPGKNFTGGGEYQEMWYSPLTEQVYILTVWDIDLYTPRFVDQFIANAVLVDTDYRYSDWS